MKEFFEENEKLSWIQISTDSPYFIDEHGNNWTPIGQNDAITWPDLAGLFQRKNVSQVEGHLAYLAAHGVTCLRIMLEYCQTEHRYLERPVGRFQPHMVQLWDDLFTLCEKYKLRILLTPFDTFWMDRRWKFHPYNTLSGGPCKNKSKWLTDPAMLNAIKNRMTFVTERWGGSGVLFAWDLWNEINPVHASKKTDEFYYFIEQISTHVRTLEMQLYGKSHPQTVSIFAPLLLKHDVREIIFRHPNLDFGSTHFYEEKTINYPRNTIDAALSTGNMVRESLVHLPEERPFLDSEHGPIDYFKKRKKNLPELFDDEYFLHIQWAHLASGGAGGGMRWPYRHPHVLTHGMRWAQQNMADFISLIDWKNFRRKNLNDDIQISNPDFAVFGCGDDNQAIVWLLNQAKSKKTRSKKQKSDIGQLTVSVPNIKAGFYKIYFWDTVSGKIDIMEIEKRIEDLSLTFKTSLHNIAIAILPFSK